MRLRNFDSIRSIGLVGSVSNCCSVFERRPNNSLKANSIASARLSKNLSKSFSFIP